MRLFFLYSGLLVFLILTQSVLAAPPIAELRARLRTANPEAEEVGLRELVGHPQAPELLDELLAVIRRRVLTEDSALANRAADLILSWKTSHPDQAPHALLLLTEAAEALEEKRAAAILGLLELRPAGVVHLLETAKSKDPGTRRLAYAIAGELPANASESAALILLGGLIDTEADNFLVAIRSSAYLARRPAAAGGKMDRTVLFLKGHAQVVRPLKEKRAALGATRFKQFTSAYRDALAALAAFAPADPEVHDELLRGLGVVAEGVSATAANELLQLLIRDRIKSSVLKERAARKLFGILANPRHLQDPSAVYNPLLPAVAILAEVDAGNPLLLPELQRLYRDLNQAGAQELELEEINRAMLKVRGRERRVDAFESARAEFRQQVAFLEHTYIPPCLHPGQGRHTFRKLQRLPPEEWQEAVELVMALPGAVLDDVKRHFVANLALASDENLAKLARTIPSCGSILDALGKEKAERDDLDPET